MRPSSATAADGGADSVEHYNLQAVIAVGFTFETAAEVIVV